MHIKCSSSWDVWLGYKNLGAWLWLDYYEHADSLSTMDNVVEFQPCRTIKQTLLSFEEYTPPVTYLEEVEKTLGTPIEVEPLNETKLEEVGLNCNHNTPFSSRKVSSFDRPEPQPLLNSPSLDDPLDPVTRISKLDIYDAMIELPKCVCNASESFKKHNQLLKLIQFLMGLDDSYMQIRSSVLSREVLPDVRSAYATISSEISYRVTAGSIAGSSQRNQASAFVSNVLIGNKFQKKLDFWFSIKMNQIPNDDERVENDLNRDKKSQSDSSSSSVSGSNLNTADFLVDYPKNDADSSGEFISTQNEEVATLELNVFSEGNLDQNPSSSHGVQNVRREPKSYFEASKYPHWTDDMNQEIDALLRNGTWEIVELLEGRKAIESKWIFKIKFKSSSKIDRYKARLVAQGFGQKEGIDYEKTFSLVVKMVTVRCLLNIAVSMSWPVYQLDVNNVFLYSDLEEVVYMKPLEGYFSSDNKVCRLKKSLYGLKQAPRQWNAKLTSTLIENGFSQSKSDYYFYTKSDKRVFLSLLVYVDDIFITSNNVSKIEKFKVFLKSKFMIKFLGKLKYFLRIEVIDTDKGIYLNQRKYVLDLLYEYGMLACKPAKIPLMSKLVISNEVCDNDPSLENVNDYQKLMGKLIYLTNTRPDISYVVHCLSQFMHSPLSSHRRIAFKILRYLKSCPGLGIHIAKTSVRNKILSLNLQLKQRIELLPVASVTSELIWILKFLKDLQIENLLPVSLHCDTVLKGVVKTVKVDSANQIANILTKGLDTIRHSELVKRLVIALEKALGPSLKIV
ncbi:ribonuclease H-like domain-containing protein [Tanacetum coccineum]